MAVNVNYNTVGIENEVYSRLATSTVCNNVYVGNRPNVAGGELDEFLVITMIDRIDDQRALGTTAIAVMIYVKNFEGGIRDSVRQSSLYTAVMGKFPYETTKYRFSYQTNSPIVQDGLGFSVQIINLQVLIKHD